MGNWLTWALLSAFFAAATALLAKLGVSGIPSNLATAIRTTVVIVFAWLMVAVTREFSGVEALTPRNWLFLFLSGTATGLSWLCYFHALKLGEVSKVAPIDKLSVPLVILFSALLLGERLSAGKVGGGLLIAAGAIVVALG